MQIDMRQIAWDLTRVSNRLAFLFGIMSHKCGAFAIRTEVWYNDLTEKERK